MSTPVVDLELMNAAFRDFVPHNRELQVTIIEATFRPARVVLRLPFHERLIGNPFTGVIHGGAITTILDAAGGASVYMHLQAPTPIATLDLRVDFLTRAPTGRDVFAMAECIHATADVAFVRARAWADDPERPFALAAATFALSTQGRPLTDADIRAPEPEAGKP